MDRNQQPLNVQALLNWYDKRRPDLVPTIECIFTELNENSEAFQALLLQGFEAGRDFQVDYPNLESGIGYTNFEHKPMPNPTAFTIVLDHKPSKKQELYWQEVGSKELYQVTRVK